MKNINGEFRKRWKKGIENVAKMKMGGRFRYQISRVSCSKDTARLRLWGPHKLYK